MALVTVTDNDVRLVYTVGGSAQDTFAIPFTFYANSEILVYDLDVSETTPLSDTLYTVNGTVRDNGFQGGTVVLDTAVTNTTIVVALDLTIARTTNFPVSADFSITDLNTEQSRIFSILQTLFQSLKQTIKFTTSSIFTGNATIQDPVANAYLRWNSTGTALINGATSNQIEQAAIYAAQAEAALDGLDDRYLGAKAADPSLDNDGNPLVVGASYFNTGIAAHKYWDGAAWQLMTTPATPAAANISYSNASSGLTATQVQAAIDELKVLLGQTNVTGDIEPTFRTTAKTGWIFLQGQTLGSASSGATLTGTTYQPLYEFIWDNIANTHAPVSSGRGASAAADFAANKTITLPDGRGRALFGAGQGTGLSGNRGVGQAAGAETVTLAEANLPSHTHGAGTLATVSAGNHAHQYSTAGSGSGGLTTGGSGLTIQASTTSAGDHTHTITGSTGSTGSGTAFAIIPPVLALNIMIKL